MRDKLDNPLPETAQAPPASPEPAASPAPLIYHPRDWAPLQEPVLQVIALAGDCVIGLAVSNRYVHDGPWELGLVAPDGITVMPFSRMDCARLTIFAPHNPAEGVGVEPYQDGRWVVRRASLAGSTSLATPATPAERAGGPMPEPAPAVELELAPPAEPPPGPPPPAASAAVDEEAAQLPALPGGAKPKPKDQQLVLDVAGDLFPDGWESISTGIIHQRVNQNLRGRNLKAVSLSTTGRALDRRRK